VLSVPRIGGLLPIVFTYCGEFLCKADRSKHISRLLAFWGLGGILVTAIASAMLPQTGTPLCKI
jgi:hypothetical protein